MFKYCKKILIDLILGRRADVLFFKNTIENKFFNQYQPNQIISFGHKNPNKFFFVIKRSPGAGFFSNLFFVLCNIKIANDKNYIPIIDMENFTTWYNEKKPIQKELNAWNYYFENINNYSLKEVYQSKNVIFSDNNYPANMPMSPTRSKELINIFAKNILVKKKISEIFKIIFKKKIKGKKILGVHFRGCDLKSYRGHPFPATKYQMLNIIQKHINSYDYIFLSTEEQKYFEFLKKKFNKKLIFHNSYRSYKNSYLYYPRKNHRYYLGRDILIEAMILSSCDMFIHTNNNVSEAVKLFSINKNQKRLEIKNGRNSNNIIISRFLWYYKSLVPRFLGGFERFS